MPGEEVDFEIRIKEGIKREEKIEEKIEREEREERIEEEIEEEKIKKSNFESNLNQVNMLQIGFYIQCTFSAFIFIWIFLIAINKLHFSLASIILLIPIALFSIGFMNSYEIADDEIENNVLGVTFTTVGLILSIPLITYLNKEKENKSLTHCIYLAMVLTLLSNLHIWTDKDLRHVCRIMRSCFETMAISLYAYVLTDFFICS